MSGDDVAYELKVDMPNLPPGELVQIVGLGTFENGGTYEVTQDEAYRFRTYHTHQQPIYDEHDSMVGSEVVLGASLLDVSESMHGVEVTELGGEVSSSEELTPPVQQQESNEDPVVATGDQNTEGGDE